MSLELRQAPWKLALSLHSPAWIAQILQRLTDRLPLLCVHLFFAGINAAQPDIACAAPLRPARRVRLRVRLPALHVRAVACGTERSGKRLEEIGRRGVES